MCGFDIITISYVDDLAWWNKNDKNLREAKLYFLVKFWKAGLKILVDKTKIMTLRKEKEETLNVEEDERESENVEYYKFLGKSCH